MPIILALVGYPYSVFKVKLAITICIFNFIEYCCILQFETLSAYLLYILHAISLIVSSALTAITECC